MFIGFLLLTVLFLVLGFNEGATLFAVLFTSLVASVLIILGVINVAQGRSALWGVILTVIGFSLIGAIWMGLVVL